MPSTRGYYCTDNEADQTTDRRKDLREVRIGGITASEGGAFGTVSVEILVYPNPEADACSHGRADHRVPPRVILPYLLRNAKDIFAGQRLLA